MYYWLKIYFYSWLNSDNRFQIHRWNIVLRNHLRTNFQVRRKDSDFLLIRGFVWQSCWICHTGLQNPKWDEKLTTDLYRWEVAVLWSGMKIYKKEKKTIVVGVCRLFYMILMRLVNPIPKNRLIFINYRLQIACVLNSTWLIAYGHDVALHSTNIALSNLWKHVEYLFIFWISVLTIVVNTSTEHMNK